jgi:hypothetical protein
MTRIPRPPLLLGLAGVLPFAWGALTILIPASGDWSWQALGPASPAGRSSSSTARSS